MGVVPYFGTKVNGWEGAFGLDLDIMINVGAEWGDEGDGVVVEIDDVREETEKVTFNKFFLRNPKLLTAVVDNLVLVRVTVDGIGAGRSVEEVREEVGYRYL